MKARIQKHGSMKMFLLNLLLLGVAGAILMRLLAVGMYTLLPNSYFLEVESITVENTISGLCTRNNPPLNATMIRHIYPFLPEQLIQERSLEADITMELFRAESINRKIDDERRTPVIEWREGGINPVELHFDITLLPGKYYIESTIHLRLPVIGRRGTPVVIKSNTFEVLPCNK